MKLLIGPEKIYNYFWGGYRTPFDPRKKLPQEKNTNLKNYVLLFLLNIANEKKIIDLSTTPSHPMKYNLI